MIKKPNKGPTTPMEIMDKPLPSNIEAERKILGCLILNNSLLPSIDNIIQAQDFYDTNHRVIFGTITSLIDFKTGTTSITIVEALRKKGLDRKIGGIECIERLTKNITDADKNSIVYYAKLIKDNSERREVIRDTLKSLIDIQHFDKPIEEVLNTAEKQIQGLREKKGKKGFDITQTLHSILDYLEKFNKGGKDLISTGWENLDEVIGGLKKGRLYVVGGRPSMGKTSFLITLALRILLQEFSVLYITLEMSIEEIVKRMLSGFSNVPNKVFEGIRRPFEKEEVELINASARLRNLKFEINDVAYTIGEINSAISTYKPDVTIVDFIDNMDFGKDILNLPSAISKVMRDLKVLALRKKTAIIVASQVDREADDKNVTQYRMRFLKGSSGKEISGDIVMFTVWPDKQRAKFHLVLEKNKFGATGILNFKFNPNYGTFDKWEG